MKAKNVLFTFITISLFLTMGVISAPAFDAAAGNRVTVGQNYQGDALLAPLYNALGDYTTKLTVVNTSENMAVVAKVVFRSPAISAETLDFFLYLTPADVWEGMVTLDPASGNAMITSTDDSCLAGTDTWASAETPMVEVFHTAKLQGDINSFGHVEILGAAAFGPIAIPSLPYSKASLYNDYHYNAGAAFVAVPNVLTGKMTMVNAHYGQKIELNMTALANWDNTAKMGWTISDTNGLYNSSLNSLAEIDATLAKTEFSLPYDLSAETGDAEVLLLTTFPTKYFAMEAGFATPYFPCLNVDSRMTYKVWNMEEGKYNPIISGPAAAVCSEVNFLSLANLIADPLSEGFTKGWVKTTYYNSTSISNSADGNSLTYAGVPMLNSYITISTAGDMNWMEAASPESAVTYNGVPVRQ